MRRAVALLASFAGCAVAPPFAAPPLDVQAPDRWTAAATAEGTVAADWWTLFGDERLTALVQEGLRGNANLRGAAARVEAAVAQARAAGADTPPKADATATAARRRQNFIGLPIQGDEVLSTTTTSFGVSLNVSWELDLWGKLSARHAAALADRQAEEAAFLGARLSLSAQIAKAYFAALEAARQLELARSTARSNRASADRIRERAERGVRPMLDLRLTEANAAASEATAHLREELLDRAVRQLEILLGRYPAARSELAASLPAVPPPIPAGLPSDLLRRRPDLAAAERRFAAAGARTAEARASMLPSFSLTASGGAASDALGGLADGDLRVWSLLGGLFAPLFQGGRLRAGVDRAAAGEEQALAAYADAALRAFAEVESALAAEAALERREAALAGAVEHSRAAHEISEARYRAGLVDIVTLLSAQRALFTAESQLLETRRARLHNRIDLILALGGGFEAGGRRP
jgi:multidrug efflux system outer membrane protein